MKQWSTSLIVVSLIFFSSCSDKKIDTTGLIPISVEALTDENSAFFADYKNYPSNRVELPIGIFDSGTGGLTVLEAFLKIDCFNNATGEEQPDGVPDFEGEKFIYLADQANMPYGNYPSENRTDYLRELIVKDALFLTRDTNRSKIVVIACNTATAYGKNDIELLMKAGETDINVVGVINAGVNAVLDNLDGSKESAVGVLATVGTISSCGYQNTIKNLSTEKGFKLLPPVAPQPGKGFAEAVDMVADFIDPAATSPRDNYKGPALGTDSLSVNPDLIDVYNFDYSSNRILLQKRGKKIEKLQLNSAGNYARYHMVSLVDNYIKHGGKAPIKSIILGCTHYPYLLDTLTKCVSELRDFKRGGVYVYREVLDSNVTFVDPAMYTAKETYKTLKNRGLLNSKKGDFSLKAYISVERGKDKIEQFSKQNINPQNLTRIQDRLPETYRLIKPLTE